MRERARLRGACDAAARRWLHHLVAAALRAWREHGALWQRVLLGLGRRSARDELRRGTLTWPNPNPNLPLTLTPTLTPTPIPPNLTLTLPYPTPTPIPSPKPNPHPHPNPSPSPNQARSRGAASRRRGRRPSAACVLRSRAGGSAGGCARWGRGGAACSSVGRDWRCCGPLRRAGARGQRGAASRRGVRRRGAGSG